MKQLGFLSFPEHLSRLSDAGDPLEALFRYVDFETFRPILLKGLEYLDGSLGGRPPYDPALMFKVLILAAQINVSDGKMAFLIRTIGIRRAEAKIALAHIAYNMKRLIFLERKQAVG